MSKEREAAVVEIAARFGSVLTKVCQVTGDNWGREGIKETPRRVAKMWLDLLTPREFTLSKFENPGYDEMVVISDLKFVSVCEHHLMPFIGKAAIGYLPSPDGYVVGLSKLGRVLDYYASRLQLQERLTCQIADYLQEELKPQGVGVVLEAEHMCMSIRGIKKPGATTHTSRLTGAFRKPEVRDEFLRLVRG